MGTVQNLDSGLDWNGLDAKMDCNIDGSREWVRLATKFCCSHSGAENILCRQVKS